MEGVTRTRGGPGRSCARRSARKAGRASSGSGEPPVAPCPAGGKQRRGPVQAQLCAC